MVSDLIIVCSIVVFVILVVAVIKKSGAKSQLPPLLREEETSIDNETGNKITQVFWKVCGRRFSDQEKPQAIEYGKDCVKIR